jgi:hypothetical protein
MSKYGTEIESCVFEYNISINKFDDLVQFLQAKIDGTLFARRQGKPHKKYSSFDEYCLRHIF